MIRYDDPDLRRGRIAFFLQDLDGGGAERAIIGLAGMIARMGHPVDLVVGDANSDYRAEVSPEVTLIDFQTRSKLLIFVRIVDYLRQGRARVVMSALDPPNLFLVVARYIAFYKGRIAISQRAVLEMSLMDRCPLSRVIFRLMMRVLFPRADVAICNSHAAADDLSGKVSVPVNKIVVIPNSVDVPYLLHAATSPLPAVMNFSCEGARIVSVGRLETVKGFATLIKAVAIAHRIKPMHLVIVGKGPERANLEELAKQEGVAGIVHFTGFDPNPYKWVASADVFVSASLGEGFPNVIAEAMTLGRRIVATDCPGDTARLLDNEKWGKLVPMHDHEIMARAIVESLDKPAPDATEMVLAWKPDRIARLYLECLLPSGVNHQCVG